MLGRILPAVFTDSLRTKFLTAGVVVLLVLAGIGGGVYVAVSDELNEDVKSDFSEDAAVQGQTLSEKITGVERRAQTLTKTEPIQNDIPTDGAALLRGADEPSYVAAALYVNSTTGEMYVRAGQDWGLFKPNRTDLKLKYAKKVRDVQGDTSTEVGVSEPFSIRDDRPPVALVATEVENHPERSIVLVLDLEALSNSTLPATNDGSYAVVTSEGKTVLSRDTDSILEPDAVATSGLDLSKSFDRVADENGNETVVGIANVGTNDWEMTRRTSAQNAFQLQSFVEFGIAGMLGAVALVLGVVGLTLVRNTVGGITTLSGHARRLREGDLDTAVTVERSDELGELGGAFDEMRESLRDQIAAARAAREEAEERREAADAFSEHLQSKADAYSETMDACADGDLTLRLDGSTESEAMTAVARSFNDMMEDLEATVRATREFAQAVEGESGSVATSTGEVRQASAQVTESVQEISVGTDEQREKLESVSSEMESLATTTEEIAASANEVADTAERSASVGRDGKAAAEDAIEGMRAIEGETEDAVAEIDALETQMREVDKLVEFISDVAHQTNMLALNANIEASRGGSSSAGDDGFQVVAQEVKELAEEAKEAAEDIEARLERIDEQTERTASQVRAVNEHVSENADSVLAASSALDEVAEYAQETNTGVQEISAATEEQAASTEEVVAMTEGATEISNRTASEAETVAAAAEEQTANLADVSGSADRLSQRASDLWDALAAFEVASDGTEGDAAEDDGEGGDERVAELPSTDGGATDVDFGDDDGDAGDDFEWSVDE